MRIQQCIATAASALADCSTIVRREQWERFDQAFAHWQAQELLLKQAVEQVGPLSPEALDCLRQLEIQNRRLIRELGRRLDHIRNEDAELDLLQGRLEQTRRFIDAAAA